MAATRKTTKKAGKKSVAKKAAPGKKAPAKATAKKPAIKPAIPPRKQPETLRLRSVSVGLTVNDVERSIAWYRDILGFVVLDEWKHEGKRLGATMRCGAVQIFLGQDDWKKGRDRLKGEGIRIYGRTVQDLDRLAAVIKAHGGVLTHDPKTESWGERDFGILDPDGFKITISTGA